MEISVLSWNVRGENERKRGYLEYLLNWLKENWNNQQDVDFIFLQEASASSDEVSLYLSLLTGMGDQVFRTREQSGGHGDCYLFAIREGWSVEENSGYIQVWNPEEPCGSPIRSPFFMEVSNRYDHILTSSCMNYECGEALDEDEDGLPVLWEYAEDDVSSINGSDHCAVFGRYVIPENN